MIVTWKKRMWEPRAARTVMGCGRERMDTSAFSSKMETLPGALSPEEEFSQWDINPVSSRLLPGTGQLYVYYSKMQIIFLRNVGRWKTDDGRTATKSFILRNYSACAWHSASSRSKTKGGEILLILPERRRNPSVSLRHIITDSAWHFEASAPSEGKVLFSWLFTHQVWCRGLGPRGVYSLHTVFKNEELGEQYGNVLLHEGLDRKKKKKKCWAVNLPSVQDTAHSASLKCWCHIFFTSSAFQQSWKPRKRWGLDSCSDERKKTPTKHKDWKGHYFVQL